MSSLEKYEWGKINPKPFQNMAFALWGKLKAESSKNLEVWEKAGYWWVCSIK